MSDEAAHVGRQYGLDQVVLWFFRGVAILILLMGVRYWLLLLGISDPAFRFDTMPNQWKIAATTLCILMPVASLGLWGLYRWGIAIWVIVIAVELFMHLAASQWFGENSLLVVFHTVTFAAFILYKAAKWFYEWRPVRSQE